jgi:hypothetical protein
MKPILFFILSVIMVMLASNLSAQETEFNVGKIENKIQIGDLAGNRSLEFGVRNILEEFLLDADYDLIPTAKNVIEVEILFLDVLTTNRNVSIFQRRNEAVVIRLRGSLVVDGKVTKSVVVEESSSEISMSTLLIDEGGNFNQTSLSNALKKACEQLILKLTEQYE